MAPFLCQAKVQTAFTQKFLNVEIFSTSSNELDFELKNAKLSLALEDNSEELNEVEIAEKCNTINPDNDGCDSQTMQVDHHPISCSAIKLVPLNDDSAMVSL